MHLLKLSVSKDARIDRETLAERLTALESAGVLDTPTFLHAWPADRPAGDALRVAARDALRPFADFTDHRGRRCKVLISKPLGAGAGVHLHVHVQARDTEGVAYSTLVCKLEADRPDASDAVRHTTDEGSRDYPDIIQALAPQRLKLAGERYLYESDLRRLLQGLLEPVTMPLWTGLALVLTPAAVALCAHLERACRLPRGSVQLRLLGLDTSQVTRTALADELGETFSADVSKLSERLESPAPNLTAISTEYAALCDKLALTQDLLGCELPCLEALEVFEMALMAKQ